MRLDGVPRIEGLGVWGVWIGVKRLLLKQLFYWGFWWSVPEDFRGVP